MHTRPFDFRIWLIVCVTSFANPCLSSVEDKHVILSDRVACLKKRFQPKLKLFNQLLFRLNIDYFFISFSKLLKSILRLQ